MSAGSASPLVSAVLPAYNARRTLPATLASIAAQTVTDLEVIVIDDGSTDDTAEVARSSGIAGLRVITQPNAGHAAARNTGVSAARGRYVAFLDADDLWLPRKLERQLEQMERNARVRALQSGAARVDNDLRVLWVESCGQSDDQLWDTLCFRNMPALMSTLLIERTYLQELGGFDPSLVILQDWDLAIRLAARNQLHCVPDILSAYRLHTSQSSSVEIHLEPGIRILDRVFSDPGLPRSIRSRRSEAYARFYAMLSGGAMKVGRVPYASYWGLRALARNPRVAPYLAGFPARRLGRRRRAGAMPESLPFPTSVRKANALAAAGSS